MLNSNHTDDRIQCFVLTIHSYLCVLCCWLLSAEHCSSHLIVVSGMIFTQQLHQCHGLVNAGQNSLSVPVPGGAILLCITHVVCDCYLSSSPFTCGWYQVVSSTLSRFIGSFPWSLLMTAKVLQWRRARHEWNQVLKNVCHLAGVIMWHITCT